MKKIISLLLSVVMLLSTIIGVSTTVLGAESWLWPVPSSSQINTYYSNSHDGLDIGGANNCSVVSTMSGTVVAVIHGDVPGKWTGYGNGVVIQHSNGYYSHYAHMNSTSVSQGQRVSQGQEVGKMGSTGNSTGTHLHFAIATSMYGAGGRINNNPNAINYIYSISPALPGPTNVTVRGAGNKLSVNWSAVSGANCYDVIVTYPNGTTSYYHTNGTSRDIPITDLGTYKLNVQSLYRPNDSTVGQIVGGHSKEITCKVDLLGPTNVKVTTKDNNFYVSWDAVSGANCYDTIITDPSGTTNWYHSSGTNITIPIKSKPGTYKIEVQSLYRPNGSSSGQIVGSHSAVIAYDIKLTAPQNVKVTPKDNTFSLTWDVVPGATCYDVVITKPNGDVTYFHCHTNSRISSEMEYGHYSLWIQGLYRENESTAGQVAGAHSETISFDLVEQTDVCEHNWSDGKVINNATCIENGVMEYTCLLCGETKNEIIPIAEHSYVTAIVLPTCTEKGYTKYLCVNCGYTYNADYVFATGHTNKIIITKSSTKKNGSIVTKCSECGYISNITTIYYPKTISLSTTSYTYNGKVKKPSVTVKDSKGKTLKKNTDYTVTYAKGRKSVGKYSVKITFKGNYSGSKTLYFTIKPKATTLSSVTAKSKGFTVKWKKQSSQTTGYQIQYSTSSKFKSAKTVTVSKNKTTAKTISKLKAKKKYYVRVRTYKTVKISGKSTKIYSSWSKAKSVTTKK